MSHTLILADDLTGAADSLAPFVKQGLRSILCLSVDDQIAADAISVVTHSRLSSAELAVAQHSEVVRSVSDAGILNSVQWIYQKIDSTLRGYPAQTLNATMDLTGIKKALVTPAFPAQGRTTQNGRVFLGEKPLLETEFADAIEDDDLMGLFERETRTVVPVSLLDIHQGRVADVMRDYDSAIFVADAETQEDLMRLAQAAKESDIQLLCGSAGLAGGLAALCEVVDDGGVDLPDYQGPVFAISGSQHPIMIAQVQTARESGIPIVPVEEQVFDDVNFWMAHLKKESVQFLSDGSEAVLTTVGLDIGPQSALISDTVGAIVKDVMAEVAVGGLFLTGGNVAEAVCHALGASQLLLLGQVEAGVVLARFVDGVYPGLYVVTKAGGFGQAKTMYNAIQHLRKLSDGKTKMV